MHLLIKESEVSRFKGTLSYTPVLEQYPGGVLVSVPRQQGGFTYMCEIDHATSVKNREEAQKAHELAKSEKETPAKKAHRSEEATTPEDIESQVNRLIKRRQNHMQDMLSSAEAQIQQIRNTLKCIDDMLEESASKSSARSST